MGALVIMMTIDDVIGLLMDVPPLLAGAWAAWFFVGLLLSIWTRREKLWQLAGPQPSSRHKSGVRAAAVSKPSSGVRAPRPVQPSVVGEGDPFSDLERLLEPEHTHRVPGDDRPLQMTGESPSLPSPQSLP